MRLEARAMNYEWKFTFVRQGIRSFPLLVCLFVWSVGWFGFLLVVFDTLFLLSLLLANDKFFLYEALCLESKKSLKGKGHHRISQLP